MMDKPVLAVEGLDKLLESERPGILHKLIIDASLWYREGGLSEADTPKTMQDALDEYKLDQDDLGAFLFDECDISKQASVKFSEVWKRYKAWSTQIEITKLQMSGLRDALIIRGHSVKKSGDRIGNVQGLSLKNHEKNQ